mmetsp:Transcript_6639/g.5746  ORF Transcript_6639/g.5746 Transcript_6639/m.5746 type:complete len:90 (+) Transcript_6639:297-566(+)
MTALSEMYAHNDNELDNIFEHVHDERSNDPKSARISRNKYKHFAIYEAINKSRGHRMPVYLSDRDPKYNKKRDKFLPEPMLLDPIVRGK